MQGTDVVLAPDPQRRYFFDPLGRDDPRATRSAPADFHWFDYAA